MRIYCILVWVPTETEQGMDPLELKLSATVSCPGWVLGTQLQCSSGTAGTTTELSS